MSLSRIINKTPLQNEKSNVYEVEQFNLRDILESRFISEGVYALEQFSMQDYYERYLVTPSFDKFSLLYAEKEWKFDHKEVSVYQLELTKPFFKPLDIKQFTNLFESVSKLEHVSVISQVLICKRQDNWRELAICQYEDYLKGNESFVDSKLIRNIQNKALNVLNKISNFNMQRDNIEEIEQKILQHGYRFECRFVLFEEKYADYFEKEIRKMVNKVRLFNELELVRVSNKKQVIRSVEERLFQMEYVNQVLSEQELYSLLCDQSPLDTQPIKLEKPVKKQSISKSLEESMILSHALRMMPNIEQHNKEIDDSKAKQINNAFKRVGIIKNNLKVNEIHQGSSLQKIQLHMSPDITYTSIKKKLEDIQAAMGNQNITIEIGDKPDTVNVYVPLEEREIVYFRRVLESDEFQEFCKNNPLPFIIGDKANGGLLFGCLSKFRHLLIAGTSGSGKSVFLTLILICLLLTVPSDELDLYLIDPKMVELTMFKGFPQTKEVITNMKKATELLDKLCAEMDRRYELMASVNVKEISTYNTKAEHKMPYIVTAIDELSDLMMVNSSVEDHIVRIAQKGRAAGVHLILATQRPSVDVVTGLIKANMPARFAFKTTSGTDSRTILDTVGAEKLLGLGDGLAKIEGYNKELERFQAPVLTLNKEDEESIYDGIKELFKDSPVNEEGLVEIEPEEEPLDKIKRIIANTSETRISELQKLMGIRINAVSDLVKELVDEGWLEKQGRGYEIIVDEEELNKFRE